MQSVPELSSQKSSRQTDFISPINPCQSDTGTPNKGLYLEAVIIWLPGEKAQLSFHRYFLSNKLLSSPTSAWPLFLTAQRWSVWPQGAAAVPCSQSLRSTVVHRVQRTPVSPTPFLSILQLSEYGSFTVLSWGTHPMLTHYLREEAEGVCVDVWGCVCAHSYVWVLKHSGICVEARDQPWCFSQAPSTLFCGGSLSLAWNLPIRLD